MVEYVNAIDGDTDVDVVEEDIEEEDENVSEVSRSYFILTLGFFNLACSKHIHSQSDINSDKKLVFKICRVFIFSNILIYTYIYPKFDYNFNNITI